MRAPLRRLALIAAAIGAAAPPLRRRLNLPRPVTSVLAWQAPVAFAWALPRTRGRDAAIYALQMWAYVAHYEMPNDEPEALLARVRVRYPIRIETALGLRQPPTATRPGPTPRSPSPTPRPSGSSARWAAPDRSTRTTSSCPRSTGRGSS